MSLIKKSGETCWDFSNLYFEQDVKTSCHLIVFGITMLSGLANFFCFFFLLRQYDFNLVFFFFWYNFLYTEFSDNFNKNSHFTAGEDEYVKKEFQILRCLRVKRPGITIEKELLQILSQSSSEL